MSRKPEVHVRHIINTAERRCRGALGVVGMTLAAAALLVVPGSSSAPPPGMPSPEPAAVIVRGTERLAWTQGGDASSLRFLAYVDGLAVSLDRAACDQSLPLAECASPLPPLTSGIHSIALAAVSTLSGLESAQAESIIVRKVSVNEAPGAGVFPDAAGSQGSPRLDTVVTTQALAFSADVVARGVKTPAQLAYAPDGRLFLAESDGRVHIIRPGDVHRHEPALDARALLEPTLGGPLGLALHPNFSHNHLVYVSFLARESRGRTVVRIVRLREVGDTLGEPATIFGTLVTAVAPDGLRSRDPALETPSAAGNTGDAPRLSFGPDRLLYVALPSGIEFEHEPAASGPRASMLRLDEDGHVATGLAPLSGMVAQPVAFDWHPTTGALWVILPGEGGGAMLRPMTAGRVSGPATADHVTLPAAAGSGRLGGALLFQRSGEPRAPVQAWVALPHEGLAVVSLTQPAKWENLLKGALGRIGDVVAGEDGVLFLSTRNGGWAAGGASDDVIVRLTPRPR